MSLRRYFRKNLTLMELSFALSSDMEKIEALIKFGKASGAKYFETDHLVYAPETILWGKSRIAIALYVNGRFKIGAINEECFNFELSDGCYKGKEFDWLIETLCKLKEYKPKTD